MSKLTRELIIKELLTHVTENMKEEFAKPIYSKINDEKWTLPELFIRQWLNNGCDGFDLEYVGDTYDWLVEIKDDLIRLDMVSKEGFNNSGFPLWNDYDYDY